MIGNYSTETVEEALEYIEAQLKSGYLDLGLYEEIEMEIVEYALELFKNKFYGGEI